MQWQQSPYILPLFATGLLTLASSLYAFRQQHIPGAKNLLALLGGVTIWAWFYALELAATGLGAKLYWAKVQYIGIAYVPVNYTLFALKYIGQFRRLKKPTQFTVGLTIVPTLTLLFVWTNEWHHLVWQEIGLLFDQGYTYLTLAHGPWFWLHTGFGYLLLVGTTLILLNKIIATAQYLQGQITLVIIGTLWPWVSNVLYLTQSNPFTHLDLTPFAFTLTALCFVWALLRFNFLDIVPIARELIIEKLEEGVIVLDAYHRVVDINKTAANLLQKEAKALLRAPLVFNDSGWTALENILKEEQAVKVELALEQAYYEVSVILLENSDGEANGRLITLHNITQRKEAELLLQQAKEAADQTKTHFLTNMSHEIRTPLNAVIGMAEILRQTPLNHNQGEMVDVVAKSSNELVSLINHILDFAKLESGDLTLVQQSFDVTDCIESAIDMVRQAANHKHLEVSYAIEPTVPCWFIGDPIRLRQILVNLLDNAIKFSEEGNIELFISHRDAEPQSLLQFMVKDSGIGIAAEQLQDLFSSFQQIDGSTTRTHGGNGLGLVICKRLVELMGGNIYLHSHIGQGTVVHFSAQLRVAAEDQPPTLTLRQHKATLTNKRLLVITNDAGQRRQISREARIAGLEVYAAGSTQEAGYWIDNSEPFDIALLSTVIWQEEPAILTQLRHKASGLPLPTVLLGTQEQHAALDREQETRLFCGFLALPVTSSQMYDLLLNVLSTHGVTEMNRERGESMAERYPLNILIVEDNQVNRLIIKTMLNNLGYQADTVINGQLAVAAARQKAYDVILMDIQMPVMDGVEATQQILATCADEERPYIIAVTAHALEGDREYYLSSGMNEYVSKPVTVNHLVEVLYQAINYQDLLVACPTIPMEIARMAV